LISPDLAAYLDRVGLQITDSRGAVVLLSRRPGSLLPDAGWAAVVLEPEMAPDTTLATVSFQSSAGPLYALSGTAERPLYVIALLRSPPGAGVYREWHDPALRLTFSYQSAERDNALRSKSPWTQMRAAS
jgi:hypothetical protein